MHQYYSYYIETRDGYDGAGSGILACFLYCGASKVIAVVTETQVVASAPNYQVYMYCRAEVRGKTPVELQLCSSASVY